MSEHNDRSADIVDAAGRFKSLTSWPLNGLADTDVIQCRVITPDYETGGIERAFFGLTVADFRRVASMLNDAQDAVKWPHLEGKLYNAVLSMLSEREEYWDNSGDFFAYLLSAELLHLRESFVALAAAQPPATPVEPDDEPICQHEEYCLHPDCGCEPDATPAGAVVAIGSGATAGETAPHPRLSAASRDDIRCTLAQLYVLMDTMEALRGDKDVLRISGQRGDAQDVGIAGIKGTLETIENAARILASLTVGEPQGARLRRGSMAAQWTYDPEAEAYYFAPMQAAKPPYLTQRHVDAILDIASDGTLAGIELIDRVPPPPTASLTRPHRESSVSSPAEVAPAQRLPE